MPKSTVELNELRKRKKLYERLHDELETSVDCDGDGMANLRIKVASFEALVHLVLNKIIDCDYMIERFKNFK
jgi:hypothetical protein